MKKAATIILVFIFGVILCSSLQAATSISSCTTISSAGTYELTSDLLNVTPSGDCIVITASNVVFDGKGRKIDRDGSTGYNNRGIYVQSASGQLTNVKITNVEVSNWNYGVYFDNVTNSEISYVTAQYNNDGIGIYNNSTSNMIKNNFTSSNVLTGIVLSYSHSNTVQDNSTQLNIRGMYLTNSTYNNILRNTVLSNTNYGFHLYWSRNNTISNNSISSNGTGFNIQNFNIPSMNGNLMYQNYIRNNTTQVSDDYPSGNYWHNTSLRKGNYWSDYRGVDNNNDGIGDTLIPHPSSGYDSYPIACSDNDSDGYKVWDASACGTIDCNDGNASVYPGATEICNSIDDDCDNFIDEGFDTDNDGFTTCAAPVSDCNDTNSSIYPGAAEQCNGVDDDCDTIVPANEADADNDGYRICRNDCDDTDSLIHPGVSERCNGLDDDCNTVVPANEADSDNDGYRVCQNDCNDGNSSVNPGATERCDDIDNDCDSQTDEGDVCVKLRIIAVPMNWTTGQTDFDNRINAQMNAFTQDLPYANCSNRLRVDRLNVATQNFSTSQSCPTCTAGTILPYIRNFVNGLGLTATYDIIAAFVRTTPYSGIGGMSNTMDTIWVETAYNHVGAHEIGHIYGLREEYCSQVAGSTSSWCNDGGALYGGTDPNFLDPNSPYSCNPNSGSGCCDYQPYGQTYCSANPSQCLPNCSGNSNACCRGNRNDWDNDAVSNGICIMSFTNADAFYGTSVANPRRFDQHDLNHLSNISQITCTVTPQASPVIDVHLTVTQTDGVTGSVISTEGRPTKYFRGGNEYSVKIVDSSNNILWEQGFDLFFDYVGPVYGGVDYSSIHFETADLAFKVLYNTNMHEFRLFHNSTLIFSKVLNFCNQNSVCDMTETYQTCPSDCPLNQPDKICIPQADSTCDPDCFGATDQDCVNASDQDGDGISDQSDNCPGFHNPGQDNYDNDGIGDVCDPDDDNDTVTDDMDNCLYVLNPNQSDVDQDGVGDVCDNCPDIYNPDQTDTDKDEVGDLCDSVCGNGVIEQGEQCDDENTDNGDGCSATCQLEVIAIKVLLPNGGEAIPSGSIYTIQWAAPSNAVKFDLKYSLNNGTTWKTIATEVTGTSYNWTVPVTFRNKIKCLVKVIGYDASGVKVGEDTSDSQFTIEEVKVTSPDGGEILESGNTWNITWRTNATISPVARVELYYTTGGGIWKLITTRTDNSGSYLWEVPWVSSAKCKVKVLLKDATGRTVGIDVSDKVFTIQP